MREFLRDERIKFIILATRICAQVQLAYIQGYLSSQVWCIEMAINEKTQWDTIENVQIMEGREANQKQNIF